MSILSSYGLSTSCKISKAKNEPILRNGQIGQNGPFWKVFGLFSGKREYFQNNWLRQFLVLMVLKLQAKYKKTKEPIPRKML